MINLDKKSLLQYDLGLYTKKYEQIINDLETDQHRNQEDLTKENLRNWLKNGIFTRRLNFRGANENFYITTAPIKRKSRESASSINYNFYDDYLFSYWSGDSRAADLSAMEIGSKSPRNGELDLIGNYEPHNKNLINIRYESIAGKDFIKNANDFLEGREKTIDEKIDINEFFKLKFYLAQQGIQSKAFRDIKNSIIDGPAGTGKSTIAIQKLKYFVLNDNIEQNKLCMIVRNKYLADHFKTLFGDPEIDLKNVVIGTFDDVIQAKYNNLKALDIEIIYKKYTDIKKILESKVIKYGFTTSKLTEHYNLLIDFLGFNKLKTQINNYIDSLDSIENLKAIENLKNEADEISAELKLYELNNYDHMNILFSNKHDLDTSIAIFEGDEGEQELKDLQLQLKTVCNQIDIYDLAVKEFKKKIRQVKNKLNKLEGLAYKKLLEQNNLYDFRLTSEHTNEINSDNEESLFVLGWLHDYKKYFDKLDEIRIQINNLEHELKNESRVEFRNSMEKKIAELKSQSDSKFKYSDKEHLDKFQNVMRQVYFNKSFVSKLPEFNCNTDESQLLYLYLGISEPLFSTIIIDEAQDFSKQEIEIARLHTTRIVLTGDILQNVSDSSIHEWEDLLVDKSLFEFENALNIFTLKHNFRQTFQLSQASYNFRKAILSKNKKSFEIEDLSGEYFENDKKFNNISFSIPEIRLIESDLELYEYYDHTKLSIMRIIAQLVPVVIICKDAQEKLEFKKIFKDYRISYDLNYYQADIILTDIYSIKGNQFPVVIANLEHFNDRELYLIISRAQFVLNLFTKSKYINSLSLSKVLIEQNKSNIKCFNLKIRDDIALTYNEFENKENVNNTEIYETINEGQANIDYNLFQASNIGYDSHESANISTIDKIEKHKKIFTGLDLEISPDVIFDEQQYKDNFEKILTKLHQDYSDKTKNKNKVKKIIFYDYNQKTAQASLKKSAREFLNREYKGFCQICGYTFQRQNLDNFFEMFHWNDKRIVKVKKEFHSTADSLCLCSNCASAIKWGYFNPIFINDLKKVLFENTEEEIIESLYSNVNPIDIPNCYRGLTDFNQIYPLEIFLLDDKNKKYIYYSHEHLLQFLVFLKLEKSLTPNT